MPDMVGCLKNSATEHHSPKKKLQDRLVANFVLVKRESYLGVNPIAGDFVILYLRFEIFDVDGPDAVHRFGCLRDRHRGGIFPACW